MKPVTLALPVAPSTVDMMKPQPMPTLQPPAMLLLTAGVAPPGMLPPVTLAASDRVTTLAEPPEPAWAPVFDEASAVPVTTLMDAVWAWDCLVPKTPVAWVLLLEEALPVSPPVQLLTAVTTVQEELLIAWEEA